jgi:preprotein translocase subunit YajC
MSHDAKAETLSGELQQVLFSPKGGIEGLLMKVGSTSIQVSMDPATVDAHVLADAIGKRIEAEGSPDHSPKTKDGMHPVYKLNAITKIGGKALKPNGARHPVSGVVASVHYAKHGEPNGVILESGEFIHTRPLGMEKLKLEVGSKVVANGGIRMTVLGTPLIEAHEVNRVTLR